MASAPVTERRHLVHTDRYGPGPGRSPWMGIDWREHQRWMRIDGAWVNVIEIGPEEPEGAMVFIHGLSGCWQNWLENLPHFARTHRCIAMDLPGFGRSDLPRERISIRGYGAFVDVLLRELGVERAAIVGNSMGGFIAAELAIAFPTVVERLVLVSAAGLSIEHRRNERLLGVLRRAENVLAMYGGWLASRSEDLTRRPRSRHILFGIVAEHPERLPAALVAEQLRGSGKKGFLDALDALTDYPIRERLGRIEAPTLVVWGEDDKLVPVHDAWEFGRLIGGAKVVVYADTGHVAMLERPAAFNALVEDFLEE